MQGKKKICAIFATVILFLSVLSMSHDLMLEKACVQRQERI